MSPKSSVHLKSDKPINKFQISTQTHDDMKSMNLVKNQNYKGNEKLFSPREFSPISDENNDEISVPCFDNNNNKISSFV